jgi:type I restriction enzyme S subunit
MRFTPDIARVDPLFLINLLQTPSIKRQILARAKNAVNQSSINQTDVRALEIDIPPLHLQHQFAIRARVVAAMRPAQGAFQCAVDALVISLQHRAFRGEL